MRKKKLKSSGLVTPYSQGKVTAWAHWGNPAMVLENAFVIQPESESPTHRKICAYSGNPALLHPLSGSCRRWFFSLDSSFIVRLRRPRFVLFPCTYGAPVLSPENRYHIHHAHALADDRVAILCNGCNHLCSLVQGNPVSPIHTLKRRASGRYYL